MAKYYFTLTAGRTGTGWLAEFLGLNLNIPSIHEPLEIDDFGVRMPDIKTMRSFNERGFDNVVKKFWKRKFRSVEKFDTYAESNHTLAKCGLIEALVEWKHVSETIVIVLRRKNKVNQCTSYYRRGGLQNIVSDWQWNLSHTYKNLILNPQSFMQFGYFGKIVWYVYEIECRQAYYKQLFGEKINFVEADLEDIVSQDGADYFLRKLGLDKKAKTIGKRNASPAENDRNIKERFSYLLENLDITPEKVAAAYISAGKRLSVVNNA